MTPTFVAKWAKNGREVIRVALDQYQGRDTIDVRAWYINDEDELRPGRAVRHLPDLAGAISKALAEAKARGLIDRGAA